MTVSRAELEAMTRDELLETVEGLDRRLSDLQEFVYTELQPRLDELEAENEELRDRLADLSGDVETIRDLGSARTSKEEKIAQIVTYAENERGEQARTTVRPTTITGIADVSRRYAYELVDDMIETYDWALDPQDRARRPDQETPQRGVLVDCEQLHTDPESVNKFTNGSGGNGGSA